LFDAGFAFDKPKICKFELKIQTAPFLPKAKNGTVFENQKIEK